MRWLVVVVGLGMALAQKHQVLIGTGGVGGVYFYYGTAVAEILNKAGVVQAQAMQSGGSIENLMLLRDRTDPARGVYYCGTVLPDAALMAYQGEPSLYAAVAPARDTTLENAVRSRGGKVPYHEGAVRYFRERGVWR
nr:TAXI family TRAP transporter solute-binding subunit [Thermus caliditerrae]